MRITAERREATRQRILARARRLFATRDFDAVTTRELAARASIATGTLFNYYAAKELLAVELLADDVERALSAPARGRRRDASLDEDLFALVLSTLRAMEPLRRTVGPVLASCLGPWTAGPPDRGAARLRMRLLDEARGVIARHGVPFGDDPVAAHLLWTLYLGVLAFWCTDDSPKQEDTLVLLDQSMRLFAGSLPAGTGRREATDER